MNPTVSIVTVTYNAAQFVEETIRSVLQQTYDDFEYVFIDGKSTDGTLEIIESYRKPFEDRGIPFLVKSEQDEGIYDAMNKSIETTTGQYVQMLNAGDALLDEHVLADVFSNYDAEADILYGDVVLRDNGFYKLINASLLETITQNMPMCHQSVFVRRSVLAQYNFNTKYKLAADYDQLLHCYLNKKLFFYTARTIAVYDTAGVSEKNFKRSLTEQRQVRESFGIKENRSIWYILLLRRRAELIKRLLPSVSRSEARGWYRSLDHFVPKR